MLLILKLFILLHGQAKCAWRPTAPLSKDGSRKGLMRTAGGKRDLPVKIIQ